MVTIKINGKERLYEDGIKYEIIAEEHQNEYLSQIALVTVNGKIRELMKRVDRDCELEFITCADQIGHKTYVRTAKMWRAWKQRLMSRWSLPLGPAITALSETV